MSPSCPCQCLTSSIDLRKVTPQVFRCFTLGFHLPHRADCHDKKYEAKNVVRKMILRSVHICWWFRNPGSTHQLRLVGSLSPLFTNLQGFYTLHPTGGWPWDFWTINCTPQTWVPGIPNVDWRIDLSVVQGAINKHLTNSDSVTANLWQKMTKNHTKIHRIICTWAESWSCSPKCASYPHN